MWNWTAEAALLWRFGPRIPDPILTTAEWANWRRARAANDALMLEMMLAILSRAGRWTAIATLALATVLQVKW
jgi:hypothetical protein